MKISMFAALLLVCATNVRAQQTGFVVHTYGGLALPAPLKEFPNHRRLNDGLMFGFDGVMPASERLGVMGGFAYSIRHDKPGKVVGDPAESSGGTTQVLRLGVVYYPRYERGFEFFAAVGSVTLDLDPPAGTNGTLVDNPITQMGIMFGSSYSHSIAPPLAITLGAEVNYAIWNWREIDKRTGTDRPAGYFGRSTTSPSILPSIHIGLQWKAITQRFAWDHSERRTLPKGTSPDTIMPRVRTMLERVMTAGELRAPATSDVVVEGKRTNDGLIAKAYHRQFSRWTCTYWSGRVPEAKRP